MAYIKKLLNAFKYLDGGKKIEMWGHFFYVQISHQKMVFKLLFLIRILFKTYNDNVGIVFKENNFRLSRSDAIRSAKWKIKKLFRDVQFDLHTI